jgi:hypothetical protein
MRRREPLYASSHEAINPSALGALRLMTLSRPSMHGGPQMLDERARFRRTPAMGRYESVDRLR